MPAQLHPLTKTARPNRALWTRAAARLVFVAALLVISQFGGLLHLAVTSHRICPEHGELVETGASVAVDEKPSTDVALESATGPDRPDAHDHCIVAAHRQQAFLAPQPVLLAPPEAVAALGPVSCVPAPDRAAGVALWLIAPKQSPPGRLS